MSNLILTILHIYGTNTDFLEMLYHYLGDELSKKFIDNITIIDKGNFVSNWGKGYNRLITSIVRAFIDVYNETYINQCYLKNEKIDEKDGYYLEYADLYKNLKNFYETLKNDKFIIRISDNDLIATIIE